MTDLLDASPQHVREGQTDHSASEGNVSAFKDRDRNPSQYSNPIRSRPPTSANAMLFKNDILLSHRRRNSGSNSDLRPPEKSSEGPLTGPLTASQRSMQPRSRSWVELLSSPLGTAHLLADEQRDYIMAMDALRVEGVDMSLRTNSADYTRSAGYTQNNSPTQGANTSPNMEPMITQEIRDRELFFREREVFLRDRALFLRERERFLAEKELFHREKEALLRRESTIAPVSMSVNSMVSSSRLFQYKQITWKIR